MVAAISAELGETGLTEALAAGRALRLEEIVAVAMTRATQTPTQSALQSAADDGGRLTRREREVAELLQQGYSDREIAAQLSITRGTAGGCTSIAC